VDRLLVAGVDTVCGANIALALADRWQVLGVSSQPGLAFDDFTTEHVRQGDRTALAQLARDFAPDWLLHCGSLSAPSWDQPTANAAWQHEPQSARVLADCAQALDAPLTVVLTDAVFAGPRMFHDEYTTPASRQPAAAAALAIEKLLADTGALLVRTHAYGWAPAAGEPGTAQQIWQALSTGAALHSDGRRYATPILATDLAELLLRAHGFHMQGLLHLTGAERTSPFRLASEMAAAFALPAPRSRMSVIKSAPETTGDRAADVAETSLSTRQARRSLETPMPMLREGLHRFAAQAQNGWRERSRLIAPAVAVREHAA
jgi:dTDP-4-dehydrorhamnose reductase